MRLQVETGTDEVVGRLRPGVKRILVNAVRAAAAARGVVDGQISLTLLGDPGIAELNRRFLGHDGPTDVISFALYEDGEVPVGDVYIGYAQALRQAAEHRIPAEQELARLAVHGTLHVLGEDHPAGEARTESAMWRLQEHVVAELFG